MIINMQQKNIRSFRQWVLAPFTVIIICLGWKYTWLGFIVPIVMLLGIATAFFKGRYVCGNLCPRGAFFDRVITPISPQRQIPSFFRNMKFRIAVLLFMIGFMVYQLCQNFTSAAHWGYVFWMMCTITTIIGIILALFIRARTWCSFCPIGTLGKLIGQRHTNLQISAKSCISCKLCEKACPMNLSIISDKKEIIHNSDCIKCAECIYTCPRQALNFH